MMGGGGGGGALLDFRETSGRDTGREEIVRAWIGQKGNIEDRGGRRIQGTWKR